MEIVRVKYPDHSLHIPKTILHLFTKIKLEIDDPLRSFSNDQNLMLALSIPNTTLSKLDDLINARFLGGR